MLENAAVVKMQDCGSVAPAPVCAFLQSVSQADQPGAALATRHVNDDAGALRMASRMALARICAWAICEPNEPPWAALPRVRNMTITPASTSASEIRISTRVMPRARRLGGRPPVSVALIAPF